MFQNVSTVSVTEALANNTNQSALLSTFNLYPRRLLSTSSTMANEAYTEELNHGNAVIILVDYKGHVQTSRGFDGGRGIYTIESLEQMLKLQERGGQIDKLGGVQFVALVLYFRIYLN